MNIYDPLQHANAQLEFIVDEHLLKLLKYFTFQPTRERINFSSRFIFQPTTRHDLVVIKELFFNEIKCEQIKFKLEN